MAETAEAINAKGENAGKSPDDNLLEPMKEVSYSEREKSSGMTNAPSKSVLINKDPNKTLPDARAKVLHLQRVQRPANSNSSSSSNDSSKSSSKKNIASSSSATKSNDNGNGEDEKEETVNFSLETIIRRGLTDQKLNTNFKNPFNFGKPDDNISLRVNPSANLFYEPSSSTYSDSPSDSDSEAKSADTGSKSEENTVTMPQVVENSENVVPVKRKRGRPRMSEEQKAEKRARNSILQAQAINNNQTMATPVDELMAMGHSMFSEYAPKKRGRQPRKDPLEGYYDANDSHNAESEHFSDGPVPKKRGRKPKIKTEAFMDSYSDVNHHSGLSAGDASGVEKKKRGRKPNFLVRDYYVSIPPSSEAQSFNAAISMPKKRGRKPKSYYLALQQQQAAGNLNMSAPDILPSNDQTTDDEAPDQQNATLASVDEINQSLLSYKMKRGRKPRAYYELLNQKLKLEMDESTASNSTHDQNNSTANSSILSESSFEAMKKKRGRKPKAYYLELQRQQELLDAGKGEPSPRTNSLSLEIIDNCTPGGSNFDHSMSDMGRAAKSTPRHSDVQKKVMFQEPAVIVRMPESCSLAIFEIIFLSSLQDMDESRTPEVVRKKRGRKPKSYYESLAAANALAAINSRDEGKCRARGTAGPHTKLPPYPS